MTIAFDAQSESLIDLGHDELLPVSEICQRRTGKRASPQKVWRWRLKGCRGVKLEAVLLSGTWHTTSKAFAAFIHGQTQAANKACAVETESCERDAATERRLQDAGLLDPTSSPESR